MPEEIASEESLMREIGEFRRSFLSVVMATAGAGGLPTASYPPYVSADSASARASWLSCCAGSPTFGSSVCRRNRPPDHHHCHVRRHRIGAHPPFFIK